MKITPKQQERLDEFDREFSRVKETDYHYCNPWIPQSKRFLLKSMQIAVQEERARVSVETFELGVMRGFKDAQKAIEKEKESLLKSWKKDSLTTEE